MTDRKIQWIKENFGDIQFHIDPQLQKVFSQMLSKSKRHNKELKKKKKLGII